MKEGSTRLPNFDKMIITYTAAAATATYMYHLGEQHVMSQHPQQAFMLAWCTTIERLRSLTIYKQTNNFMRGFLQHQQQLEADCHWLLTSFKVITTDENTTFLNVFDRFGWQQRYVWSFNLLVDLNKVLRQNMTIALQATPHRHECHSNKGS